MEANEKPAPPPTAEAIARVKGELKRARSKEMKKRYQAELDEYMARVEASK